ncbi:MAG: CHAD domain-containing protein [Steroidobacteraceae bacterium]
MRTVRQALAEQLDKAIAGLERRNHSDRAVHEVRREIKRARATLRLLREGIGVDAYNRENALLRDAARPLTLVRDAKVLLETLRRLGPGTGAKEDTFLEHLHRALRRERGEVQRQLRPQELAAAAAVLRAVKRRLEAVPEQRLNQAALSAGLERTYKSGRKAFARVRHRPTDECLHEWRKQAKYFANQLEIVLPLGPKRFAKSYKRSRRLAQHLGDDHDLAILNGKIFQYAKGPNAASQNDAVEELISRLAGQRKALQRKAYRLGRRLYSARPHRIQAKVERVLRAAKSTIER